MPIVFINDSEEYEPLALEPYATLNHKLDDNEEFLDGTKIKLVLGNHKKGMDAAFTLNDYSYCEDMCLKFEYLKYMDNPRQVYLIHHSIEYDFHPSFSDFERDMCENIKSRAPFIYIPEAEMLEVSYSISYKNARIIVDTIVDEKYVRRVSNQLISLDVSIFARGW